ncbi:hypothetical protein EV182_004248 [Spiromyces aspiralis]|uniref:Uncharacterized protein n=1 Tax=Spiromyces aspiralis TaxID=68401 RepID=A0ACC1HP77_9FUNG|nr:hypothetical protein EV182_004248 [Spiromyces aspiralis]
MYEVIVRSNRISIGQGAELGHSAKSQEVASTPCAVTLAAIKPIVLLYNQLGDAELQLRFEVGKVLVTVFRHNAQVRQRTDPQGDFIDVSTDSVKRSAVRRTTSELMKYYSVVYNLLTRDVATGKGTDSCGPGSAQLQPQRQASATPSDYVAIGAALCAITEWLHMREVVIILQMLYTARQTLTCAVEGAASRQHPHIQLLATETLIGVYLSRLAQVLASDAEGEKLELVKEFSEYVRSVINARQELNRPGERVAWISTIDDMSKEDISKWELLEFPRNIDYLSPLSSAISVPDGTAREEEGNKAAVPMFEPLKVIEYLSQLGKLSGNQLRDDGLAPVDLTQFEPIDLRDVAKSLLSLELRQEDIDSEDNKERRSMPSGILDRINPHVMFKAVPSDDGTASEEESRQESVEGDVEGEVETAGKNWLRTASTRDSVATPVNFSYLKLALSQGLVDLSSVGVSTLSESNHAIDSTTRVYAHGNSGGGSSNVSGTVNAPSSSSSSSAKATPSSVRQEDINKQMDEDPKDNDDDENYQDQVVKLLDSLDIVYTPSGGSSGRDRETPASTTTTAHHRSMTVVHYRKACHDHDDRQSLTLLTDPFASPASMPATLRPSRHTDD